VPAAEPQRPCREHPKVSGPCFTFRGRLANYNGNPTARVWRIGTTRILGVSDGMALPEFEKMPANAKAALGGSFDLYVFGDFEFCPFTPDKPGVMRLGCLNSAKNLKVVEHR
jgi:hypothetical protein